MARRVYINCMIGTKGVFACCHQPGILSHHSGLSFILSYERVIQTMGRSFLSTRQGVNIIADRWTRLVKKLTSDRGGAGGRVVLFAKQHSSEGFAGCDDPLEAVIFSALVEIARDMDRKEEDPKNHGDR